MELSRDGGINFGANVVPVLLVDETPEVALGASRVCTWPEVISYRGSLPRFVVIHHHDDPVAASISSTVTTFGQAEIVPIGRGGVERWKTRNPLIAELLEGLLFEVVGRDADQQEQLEMLLATAIDQAGEGESLGEEESNNKQWRLFAEFINLACSDGTTKDHLVAALGFPRLATGVLDEKVQVEALKRLAEHLESAGIGHGVDELIGDSSETLAIALSELKAHLHQTCNGPQFRSSPSSYFRPPFEEGSPKGWWWEITVEKIVELLAEQPIPDGLRVKIDPTVVLFPPGRGVSHYVLNAAPRFRLEDQPNSQSEDAGQRLAALLETAQARRRSPRPVALQRDGEWWFDNTYPEHSKTIDYIFEAEGFRETSVKVIVLDRYRPGFILRSTAARKIKPPRPCGPRARMDWTSELELPAPGRHLLEIVFDPRRISFDTAYIGNDTSNWPAAGSVRDALDWVAQRTVATTEGSATIQLDVEGACACILVLRKGGSQEMLVAVALDVGAEQSESVPSLYQALIERNLDPKRSQIQIAVEVGQLHDWQQLRMCESGSVCGDENLDDPPFAPVVFAHDVLDAPLVTRENQRPILSHLRFVSDPRPLFTEADIPRDLRQARGTLHSILRALREKYEKNYIEELPLFELLRDPAAVEAIREMLISYRSWVRQEGSQALWFEAFAYFEPDSSGVVLEREPTALLLPPTHPLRLAWMVLAQGSLQDALDAQIGCPLASVLNPCAAPDCLSLPCSTGTGREDRVAMIAVNTSSAYWGVLWNAKRLDRMQSDRSTQVFSEVLRIELEGVAGGLSEGQVRRALGDIDRLGCARGLTRVTINAQETGSTECTRGIERWCSENLGEEDVWAEASPRRLEVLDFRGADFPEPEDVANLSRSSLGTVEWYDRRAGNFTAERKVTADLALLSRLGTLQPEVVPSEVRSATGTAGLVRYRVRRHHATESGHLVTESRVSCESGVLDQGLSNPTRSLIYAIEATLGERAFQFAPNWNVLHLAVNTARYCAVSSSDTDPSGFSNPNAETYLWDYDLPAKARHGVQDSGYYLVARSSDEALGALHAAFRTLGSQHSLSDEAALLLLAEISNRGVPSLKNLSAGGYAASGELGVLSALQLLQPGFQSPTATVDTLFPASCNGRVNMLIPVDPFRDQLEVLNKAVSPALPASRPDLLAISIGLPTGTSNLHTIRFVPIEVKFRSQAMSGNSQDDAIGQARAMSKLLRAVLEQPLAVDSEGSEERAPDLWMIATRALFASWIDFGFRIYARSCGALRSEVWAERHEAALRALLDGETIIEVDNVGRLILIHNTRHSSPRDRDADGFSETIELSPADAAELLALPERRDTLAQNAVEALPNNWELLAPLPSDGSNSAINGGNASVVPLVGSCGPQGVPSQASPVSAPENGRPDLPGNGACEFPGESQITDMAQLEVNDTDPSLATGAVPVVVVESNGVRFEVGLTTRQLDIRPVVFHPSNTRLSHLNVGIVGDMGTGKTQLTKYLVTQLSLAQERNRGHQPRFLIFDYKRDYSQADFVNAVGARLIPPENIPLNILALPPRQDGRLHDQRDWVRRANFIYDTLHRIYAGIGPVQKDRLKRAVVSAYQTAAGEGRSTPLLGDVFAAYELLGRPDSVSSILSDLIDMQVFTDDATAIQDFGTFLNGVIVIQLSALGADQNLKNTLVVLFLNLFYDFMIGLEKKPFVGNDPQLRNIEAFLLVDEADNIMKHDFQVLRQVLQEGREFGVGVFLASQYLSHFRTTEYDYREPLLTWFIHRVPNVTSRDVEGLGLGTVASDVVSTIKMLENHEFFYKSLDEDGTFALGKAFWRLNQEAWAGQNPEAWARFLVESESDPKSAGDRLRVEMQEIPPDITAWLTDSMVDR
jgi:hypothetical protein